MQQALDYAEILDVPFAYSSNGDAFLEHDRTAAGGAVTREIPLDQFPSPDALWSRYCASKMLTAPQVAVTTHYYYYDGSRNSPRYYPLIPFNLPVSPFSSSHILILLFLPPLPRIPFTPFLLISTPF